MVPPNATHLMQSLDVAVFSSVKKTWMTILTEWKREVRTAELFNKERFATLLCNFFLSQEAKTKANLIAGFRTTGIFP